MLIAALTTIALLNDVRSVRALPADEARRALPVHVRGIVTNLSGWKSSFFVMDDSAGISVDRRDTTVVRPGDEVEIDGVTAPGLFAPVILSDRVRVTGHRELPPAPLVHLEDIAAGQKDSQWLTVHGVVRSATIERSWGRTVLFLNIDLGVGSIAARVHDFSIRDPASLIDAEVTVRGVCGTNFNDRRQFIGLRLFVNDLSDVKIEHAAPADPFAIPTQPIAAILQFNTVPSPRHRMKVEGVVTWQDPGRRLCIQNGDDGVCVETRQMTSVAAGTPVEVAGFASAGAYSPILQSALFRIGGHARPPRVVDVTPQRVIRRDANMFLVAPYDALLIRLRGELIEHVTTSANELLLLQGGVLFHARVANAGAARFAALEDGTQLELTGVCRVHADENREPKSFDIDLRTPADIRVVAAPPWWNLRHSIEALGGAVLLALAVTAWALQRQKKYSRVSAIAREWTSTFDAAPNPIFVTGADLRIRHANRAGAELLQWDVATAAGRSLRDLTGEPWLTIAALCDREVEASMEVSATEAKRSWDISLTIQPDGNLDERRYIIMLRDVTATRELQKSLQRAETMSAMGTLVAGVLHEVRNPLFSISATVDTLEARANSDLIAKYIERLRNDVGRLRRIMSDLLEYGRPHSLNRQNVALSNVISAAAALVLPLAETSGVSIDVDDSPAHVCADSDRLRQVFHNLIENAAQHMPNGGKVRVRIREESRRGAAWVVVTVEDEGTGFTAADLRHVFEPFFTRRRGGTGLGLSIVRRIVEEHGGSVDAANLSHGGAVVSVALRA